MPTTGACRLAVRRRVGEDAELATSPVRIARRLTDSLFARDRTRLAQYTLNEANRRGRCESVVVVRLVAVCPVTNRFDGIDSCFSRQHRRYADALHLTTDRVRVFLEQT